MTRLVILDSLPAHPTKTNRDELAMLRGAAVSIGNFDGVHVGHQSLLRRLKQLALRFGGPSVAVVFDPHPATILRPESAPPQLTTLLRRAELMGEIGIDVLLVCQTKPDLLRMTAERFFDALMLETLAATAMVEGPNFFFGKNRAGNVELLSDRCAENSIQFEVAEAQDDDIGLVSSSRIRKALGDGEVAAAAKLLGHAHQVDGRVVQGAQRGRTIGFPTANLAETVVMLPAPGVYGGVATLADGSKYVAAIHLGNNPTFEKTSDLKLEVHLLDYSGSLYEETLAVDFRIRVRDVQKFDSSVELSKQLQRDVSSIRQLIKC